MTDTISPLSAAEIAAFAADVRAALADLPPEEVDDLTDGLEADLAERLEDAPDAELGDPAEYAAELRAAAGYPAATRGRRRPEPIKELGRELRDLRDAWRAFVDRHRWVRATADLLLALKPAWWVFRGWALYLVVGSTILGQAPVPGNPFGWALLIAAIVVSVQFGRRLWLANPTSVSIQRVIDVTLAVLALPIVISVSGWYQGQTYAASYVEPEVWFPAQLNVKGDVVENVFVYDESGQLVERAQLFDQNGNPLDLVIDDSAFLYTSDGSLLVPSDATPGETGWNVYPLETTTEADLADGDVDRTRPATPPFREVRPLSGVTTEDGSATLDE